MVQIPKLVFAHSAKKIKRNNSEVIPRYSVHLVPFDLTFFWSSEWTGNEHVDHVTCANAMAHFEEIWKRTNFHDLWVQLSSISFYISFICSLNAEICSFSQLLEDGGPRFERSSFKFKKYPFAGCKRSKARWVHFLVGFMSPKSLF